MRSLSAEAKELARSQRSLVSRSQLNDLGCGATKIRRLVAAGLLEPGERGWYRVSGAAVDHRQQAMAAVERAGAGARIAGAWACALQSMPGFSFPSTDHVAIGPTRRVRGVAFTVVRTDIPAIDTAEVDGIPTVTLERALIGAAATMPHKRILDGVDHLRSTGRLRGLQARADALGRTYGAPQMREILASRAATMESPAERRLDRIFHAGDPVLVPQVWVLVLGRWFRLDFAYLEARLALEYDGRRTHDPEADAERDLVLSTDQIQTLRITRGHLHNPERTRRRILDVYQRRVAMALPPIAPAVPPWLA